MMMMMMMIVLSSWHIPVTQKCLRNSWEVWRCLQFSPRNVVDFSSLPMFSRSIYKVDFSRLLSCFPGTSVSTRKYYYYYYHHHHHPSSHNCFNICILGHRDSVTFQSLNDIDIDPAVYNTKLSFTHKITLLKIEINLNRQKYFLDDKRQI